MLAAIAERALTRLDEGRRVKPLDPALGEAAPWIAHLLGPRLDCFLFQLPPSFRYSATALKRVVSQLDSRHRNVIEFRHKSWWHDDVFALLHDHRAAFCIYNMGRESTPLVATTADVYVRFHGPRGSPVPGYSDRQLRDWAKRIADPLLREDLEKCFAGDPEERFASVAQLANNLRALDMRRAARGASENKARYRSIVRQGAAAALVAGLYAILAVYAFKQRGSNPKREVPSLTNSFEVPETTKPFAAMRSRYMATHTTA